LYGLDIGYGMVKVKTACMRALFNTDGIVSIEPYIAAVAT